jgi:hypothetical protein
MRFRILAPAILGLVFAAAPVRAETPTRPVDRVTALAASRAGLYTLTLSGVRGEQMVDLAIEQAKAGFTALLLTPAHESWLSNVKFDGARLTGTTMTSAGVGMLVLEMTDTGTRGTLTVAGRTIAITGTRDR